MIIVYEDIVRTQYVIMNILRSNKATNYMRSMTLEEIQHEEVRNKPNTLYEYSDAKVHPFRKFRAPFSGKAEHTFPE